MRRTMTLLSTLALGASLAFAPVTTADEEADGPTIDLTATADGATVAGTLAYGGAATVSTDEAGDATIPMVGLDIGDVRIEQVGRDLKVSLDVLDAIAGEVLPTALYKIDMPGSLSLMAFRGPDQWDYQLADFSDGYTSSDAEGEFDGSTITWTVPATSFGSAGSGIIANQLSSQGLSPAGGLVSLQLSGLVNTDTGTAIAQFFTGGRVNVAVTDATDKVVATAVAFAGTGGNWTQQLPELAPGTYTVTATSAYATTEATATAELVIE